MTHDDEPAPGKQSFPDAAERFVGWLDKQVTEAGRGDRTDELEVDPSATFWLGRLAPELTVQKSLLGDRGERLDPCAVGMRLRPAEPHPWALTITVSLRAWIKGETPQPGGLWQRLPAVVATLACEIDGQSSEATFGAEEIARLLTDVGAPGLRAEVRIEVEDWNGRPELVVTLVNTSPDRDDSPLACTHLFETSLVVDDLETSPFTLEALPDSFRYDRHVPALGVNAGIRTFSNAPLRMQTTDTTVVDRGRPEYWNSAVTPPDLRFDSLATDPLPQLNELVAALGQWNREHWNAEALDRRADEYGWSERMRAEAGLAATDVGGEQQRLEQGILSLADPDHADLLTAFKLMNRAMAHAAEGYDAWRPFQLGFLLGSLRFLVDPAEEARTVDTVWFATGGGKTETYLGLLITAAFYDRLVGKATGVTAWSRFPLRMLSLQQTQRFADALAGAELVRRDVGITGAPFSLGFYVGANGTPNRVALEATEGEVDAYDDSMPARYQVLLRCPFCRGDQIEMSFDRRAWRLLHCCLAGDCPWDGPLPFYVVDEEIYRYLPTVVIGTLDKAALLGMQAASRGLVGPPLGLCSESDHGYTYAPRKKTPTGCLVPKCAGTRRPLLQDRALFAPRLRLQDELHLLRDSLGAVDSHYESLLDHLQHVLGGAPAKIVASSATLTGYDRQVDVLYRRAARVFPQPGISTAESFWTVTRPALNRRYVAVAPRGVTHEFVSDRTIGVLQHAVRRLLEPAEAALVCEEAGIELRHAPTLLLQYGTDVIYGTTLYDVEGALRSLDSNVDVAPLNSATLTGQTDFDEVRETLGELQHPREDFNDRLHVIAASSMLSHGVDIERLNVMVMLGLPLTTAEFIQTTARVGRRWPGLIYVLHKVARERDAATFRQFDKFVTQGDRFVEAIPITRRSRRVLRLTTPGLVEARRLLVHEPQSAGQRLTTVAKLRDYLRGTGDGPSQEAAALVAALGFDASADELLRGDLEKWLKTWWANLEDPASGITWPQDLSPSGPPMRSLRDVEESAPIHD